MALVNELLGAKGLMLRAGTVLDRPTPTTGRIGSFANRSQIWDDQSKFRNDMSLLDAFIPQRQQRLLRVLVLNPKSSFHVNELVRCAGQSKSAGTAILDRFMRCGLLTERRVGNQRRLQFNEKWPLAQELRQMFLKSFGVAEPISEALASLISRISLVFVFGSVVTGTDHAESDIDLMVVGDVSTLELIEALAPLKEALKRPVTFNLYCVDEWALMQTDPVVASIMNGPRLIIHEAKRTSRL